MFVRPDFQTKTELRQAVKRGDVVNVWSDVLVPCPVDGELISVSGPRSVVSKECKRSIPYLPDTRIWSARVLWKRGKIVLVR